jgi:hypothetical protein
MEDDDVPWADPSIRADYEAALGRFILAFNEVDFRLAQLIRHEVAKRGCAHLVAIATRGSFAQRVDTLELLITACVTKAIETLPIARLRSISGDRNILAHGHFDQNPFDGSYIVVLTTKTRDYPTERIERLISELKDIADQFRHAELEYHFSDVVIIP